MSLPFLNTAPGYDEELRNSVFFERGLHATSICGVAAADLARHGLTGRRPCWRAASGSCRRSAATAPTRTPSSGGLGADWELPRVVFKPYPCNHFTHAGVGAALRLRAQGLAPADVTAIELSVAKPVLRTIAEPPEAKARPASGYHAAFSGPYTVAAALLGGGLGVSHEDFTDAAARDPRRLALAALVLRRGRALQRVVPARLPRRPARDYPHGRGT
jgi:2-methylcitrate dehydratase PrpD